MFSPRRSGTYLWRPRTARQKCPFYMCAAAESQVLTQQHSPRISREEVIFHCLPNGLNELIIPHQESNGNEAPGRFGAVLHPEPRGCVALGAGTTPTALQVARSRSGAEGGNCMQLGPKSKDFTSLSVPEFITFMKIQGAMNEQCEKQRARLFLFFFQTYFPGCLQLLIRGQVSSFVLADCFCFRVGELVLAGA